MISVFRVLVVEDDSKLGDSIVARLRSNGYNATHAQTGEDAFFLILTTQPDLVILDLTLPHRGGLEILTQVRAQGLNVRVIILTSHNSVEDRVAGLRAGADDYLGKPFSFPELLARVSASLRRTAPKVISGTLQLADLIVDQEARIVTRGGSRLELTTREYDLLLYLFEHRNGVVSREMLVKDVWHEASRSTPIDNIINVQVTRLRRKIDDPFPVKLLHTIHGVGFALREPPR
ncbi:response regulator transcription factor [Granulicella arctica]|uniref:response regulator transcription factor n=1 Tax=Granulicella arctica TaxID=940613 RepID=UPI0021DF95EF|nr:response regulator transcription factor [Granulicella arctica]